MQTENTKPTQTNEEQSSEKAIKKTIGQKMYAKGIEFGYKLDLHDPAELQTEIAPGFYFTAGLVQSLKNRTRELKEAREKGKDVLREKEL